MLKWFSALLVFCTFACGGQGNGTIATGEQDVILNCNSPDAPAACMFFNAPEPLTHIMQISEEQDVDLVIAGKVVEAGSGSAVGGIRLYAYHTDSSGRYTSKGQERGVQRWHGQYHGWCRTDKNGNFEIRTIRPAPYPSGGIPAHIHIYLEWDDDVFYVNDFVFSDDTLVDEVYLNNLANVYNPPETDPGIVDLRMRDGVAYGARVIRVKR